MKQPEFVGPYAIQRELGRGGMGIVYAGLHREMGRPAAIKVLLQASKGEDRFWRECEALGKLQHPGIVKVYEAGVHEDKPFLALEFVQGKSLQDALDRSGPWDNRRAAELGLAMAEAMAYVHELGLLHRDLKPDNVLLEPNGRAKITDFGLVRGLGEGDLTKTGVMLGTPSFMPPEQAGGDKRQVGPHSDVYSLGATLFAVLTGVPPLRGDSPISTITKVFTEPAPAPSSLVSTVDAEWDEILLRCLAKKPEERYPHAGALAEALRAYLRGELEVEPKSMVKPLALAAGVFALLFALGLGALSSLRSTPTPAASLPAYTLQDAKSAWLKAKRENASQAIREWERSYGAAADEGLLGKARRRLAELEWDELGGPKPESNLDDLRRLRWHLGARAWLAEHSELGAELLVGRAQELIAPWESTKAEAPLLAALTLSSRIQAHDVADPLVLPDGRLVLYGKFKGSARLWSLAEGFTDVKILPNEGSLKDAQLRGSELWFAGSHFAVRWDQPPGDQPEAPQAVELVLTDAEGSPVSLGAKGVLPLPVGALVYGEAVGTKHTEPLHAFIPDWPSLEGVKAESTQSFMRHAILTRDGTHAYVTGGTSKALSDDSFLTRLAVSPSGLKEEESVRGTAAGVFMALSPDEALLFVGFNRGSSGLYLAEDLRKNSLRLSPTLAESKIDSGGGVAIQATGAVFLKGGILVACDFVKAEGEGWLAFYPSESVSTEKVKDTANQAGKEGLLVYPAWTRALPAPPGRIALSPDKKLLYVGSTSGKVWVYPTPTW